MEVDDGKRGGCSKTAKIAIGVTLALVLILIILLGVFLGLTSYAGSKFTTITYCIWRDQTPANFQTLYECPAYKDKTFDAYFTNQYVDVNFTSRDDNVSLQGWFLQGNSSYPTIIVTHGIGGCRNHFNALFPATALRKNGFNVLVYSLRNHFPSQNTTNRASWGAKENLDVLGAFDFINKVWQGGKDASQIGLFGISMGGASSYIAFGKQKDIPAIFLDSAVFTPKTALAAGIALAGFPDAFVPGSWAFTKYFAGANLDEESPAKYFVDLNGRHVFAAHSTDDDESIIQDLWAAGNQTKQEGGDLGQFQISTLNGQPRGKECDEHCIFGAYNSTMYEQLMTSFFKGVFKLA